MINNRPHGTALTHQVVSSKTTTIDLAQVGDLLATAFHTEPVTCWLVPDPIHRAEVMPAFFTSAAVQAATAGWVDVVIEDQVTIVAAALWFDQTTPGEGPEPDPHLADVLGREAAGRWRVMDDLMTRTHPTTSHRYLMLLGVHPDLRDRRLGSSLLHDRHGDGSNLASYLEATTSDSRRLYERHGYQEIDGHFRLPGGPALTPMLRPAGTLTPPTV